MRTVNCRRHALRGALKLLAVAAPLLFGPIPTAQTRAQTQNGTTAVLPKFAVAAIHPIKPSEPGQGPRNFHSTFTPDGLLDEGVPLNRVIQVAFGVSEEQILRLPDWTRGSYYIAAKVDAADVPQFSKLTLREKWAMVLMLFEDRFGLKFHHERENMQTYTLVIAKGGPKLKKSDPEQLAKDAASFLQSPPPQVSGSRDGLHVEQNGASMASVVALVSRIVHSPVIDKTELTDRYDFKLDYSPDALATARGSEQAPNVFTALQEQLGLKLELGKGSVDVIVVDHIEQPSPN
jgi:uncharacterized protein (TIGR03435 family)